jgi:5-bromo-4-chloroindolyl phosphate hydrolysis protein
MVAISMPFQEAEIISAISIPLGISDLALGIIVALIFGCILFIVKCGKQTCDNIKWIIDICRMNMGKGKGGKEKGSDVESSVEGLSKEEIEEIKEEISNLSQQIKAILAEIKQIRKTEVLNALENDIRAASTEYAMKFELKRPEYNKAMRILQVMLAKMPEEAVAYKQKVIQWIAKAQKKFEECSPEKFGQEVLAAKAKHRGSQN